jgi:hypothetical protein
VDGVTSGPWRCLFDVKFEARGDTLLASLVTFRARRTLGAGRTLEVRAAFAAGGAFWVALPQALLGVRPLRLGAGERVVSVRTSWGRISAFATERGFGRAHRLECGIACRWQLES